MKDLSKHLPVLFKISNVFPVDPWIFFFYDSTNTSRFVHTIWNRWYFARSIQLLQRHWGHLHWAGTMWWTTLGVPAENFLLIIGFRFWHPTSVCTRQVWGIWGIWVFDAATVKGITPLGFIRGNEKLANAKLRNAAALSHRSNQNMSAAVGWQLHHLKIQAQRGWSKYCIWAFVPLRLMSAESG